MIIFPLVNCCIRLWLLFTITHEVKSRTAPSVVRIGLFGDKFSPDGGIDDLGTKVISSMVMAVKEINNKSDGNFDNLLPKTKLKFALRSTNGNFLKGFDAAQDFALKVFNGAGVVGVIGTGHTESSRAMGQAFAYTPFGVNNVDYGASSSDLSHGGAYPYYARTCPSDGYDGVILARIIKLYFGWNVVNLFFSADTYGTDTSEVFINEAAAQGIEIENKFSFWPGVVDFARIIEGTKSRGILKIFVLIMKSEDAGALLEAGYTAGLFKEGTQIIGTQYVVDPAVWESMSRKAPVPDIMKGVIGISPFLSRDTAEFRAFIQRFTSQPDTKMTKTDGTITCNLDKDDDGGQYLYTDKPGSTSMKDDCAGVAFSRLRRDGADLHDQVAYAYDAVYVLADALHRLLYIDNNFDFTGDDLVNVILNEVRLTGVTGVIDIFSGYGGSLGYALGDRQTSLHYKLVNFNPNFYHKNGKTRNLALRTTGFWNADRNEFSSCDMDFDDFCSDFLYNTADGELVDGEALVLEVELENWAKTYLRVGGAFALVVTMFYLFLILLFLDSKAIRSGQPFILFTVLIGGALASIQIVLASYDTTDELCIARLWLGHFSFACVFTALLAKTWRVGRLVKSVFTPAVKVTARHMYLAMCSGLSLFCVVLMVDTLIARPHRMYDERFDGHHEVREMKCSSDNGLIRTIIFILEGVVLFYGTKLCWDARNAPGEVNDTTEISLAIYLILFVCAVTFPVVFLSIQPTPQNLTLVMASGFIVASVGVLNILLGKRTLRAVEGVDDAGHASGAHNGSHASRAESSSNASFLVQRLHEKIQDRLGIKPVDRSNLRKSGAAPRPSLNTGTGVALADWHKSTSARSGRMSRRPSVSHRPSLASVHEHEDMESEDEKSRS